jgi:hypothetical protein
MWNFEVEQQTKWQLRQLQIRKQLSTMYRQHSLDALDFDDALDNEVDLVRRFESGAVVHNRQRHLAPKLQRGSAEFIGQTFLVHALDESGTQGCMNPHRRADHFVADVVGTHARPSVPLCVLCSPLCPLCATAQQGSQQ